MTTLIVLAAVYVVGYLVIAVLLAIRVFSFGGKVDLSSAAAATGWALFWPIFLPFVLPCLLVFWIAKRLQ